MAKRSRRAGNYSAQGWRAVLAFGRDHFHDFPKMPALAELRAAWQAIGDRVMAERAGRLFQRPWGWWKFERGIDPPDDPATWLEAHDLLTAEERRHLTKQKD